MHLLNKCAEVLESLMRLRDQHQAPFQAANFLIYLILVLAF